MHAIETVADLFVAMTIGGALMLGATATDIFVSVTGGEPYALENLCTAQGGTYDPKAEDVCPNGKWSSLIPYAD